MSRRQRHLPIEGRGDPEYDNATDLIRQTIGLNSYGKGPIVTEGGVRRINRQYAQLTIVDGFTRFGDFITHNKRVRIPKGHPWRERSTR
ncbi:hypothetical protein [Frigoribacterium sp. VKM Ac-2530]|uniref:hypothetical protein n=1 Tax=Frigoribacterium sp. VKM Ac-2530 TaxID=2783822 RepID=UPI001889DE9E|nr:hypothetical protein [Frigoribacterium sp. VKM Ac-2530]MBF4578937.1 hypothetical protein [Frigoribacterium sp. VKM Ac-2530]